MRLFRTFNAVLTAEERVEWEKSIREGWLLWSLSGDIDNALATLSKEFSPEDLIKEASATVRVPTVSWSDSPEVVHALGPSSGNKHGRTYCRKRVRAGHPLFFKRLTDVTCEECASGAAASKLADSQIES